ncbi:hypothetical protein N7510_001930 [Penicillium lagena]|uniref:uncharacterized protein n=1 Tax=Penicillium lagena TaxID=94218 RepID=UPI002540534C|nr:uncharacterized protein N7510_001930 [Penicillium lagena]KAJ5625621.1 hypothetical protein N7510_001930 [Penicillium lagena]
MATRSLRPPSIDEKALAASEVFGSATNINDDGALYRDSGNGDEEDVYNAEQDPDADDSDDEEAADDD